jgi:restriction system protein
MVKDSGAKVQLPTHGQMAWPTLETLRDLNRSATNKEIEAAVAERLQLSTEQLTWMRGNTSRSWFSYRLTWSRTLLRSMGAIQNDAPTYWSITERGRTVTQQDIQDVVNGMLETFVTNSKRKQAEFDAMKRSAARNA